MYWAYVLQNAQGKFYIGHTGNLLHRLQSHNDTGTHLGTFTRKNGAWTLVWTEEHPNRLAAMAREKLIKPMRSGRWLGWLGNSGKSYLHKCIMWCMYSSLTNESGRQTAKAGSVPGRPSRERLAGHSPTARRV